MQRVYTYNRNFKNRSRSLRKDQTDAERLLWQKLRSRQLLGYKFIRQFPIDSYILDFYCAEKKIAIELDGGQHLEQINYDNKRTQRLNELGIKVIRFYDNDTLRQIDIVLERICEELRAS